MITNLFIDTSVLAFPPEVDNVHEDCENIKKYLRNMYKLILLFTKIPNISFSIRKGVETDLAERNFYFSAFDANQNRRLAAVRRDKEFDIEPKEIANFYSKVIFNEEQTIRFENNYNVQDIEENTLQRYHESAVVCTEKFFEDDYRKLISFISSQNIKYTIADVCYIAICGKGQDFKENTVNITRVWKTYERNKNYPIAFKELEDAYNAAKQETKESLSFGEDIDANPNISIVYNDFYNTPPIPDKIYYYLRTLGKIVEKLNSDEKINEDAIDKLANILGCNSSPEYENSNYENCRYRRWHDGKKDGQFTFHLKPTTSPYHKTTRIYYKYDKEQKKIVVGMILEHPRNCGGCEKEEVCSKTYTIGSVMNRELRSHS